MTVPLKATITRIEQGVAQSLFAFHFNPSTLSTELEAKYDHMQAPGGIGSRAELVYSGDKTMTIKIFLAAYRSGLLSAEELLNRREVGLLPEMAEIESWCRPSLDQFLDDDSLFVPTPVLLFSFGTNRTLRCVCKKVSFREIQFDENYNPTIVEATVTLQSTSDTFAEVRADMLSLSTMRERYHRFGE